MRVVVVRAVVDGCEPGGLCIGDLPERSRLPGVDLLGLALNLSDLQSSVGGLEEDLVSVESKEGLGRILAG